jgi:hypothetical protein
VRPQLLHQPHHPLFSVIPQRQRQDDDDKLFMSARLNAAVNTVSALEQATSLFRVVVRGIRDFVWS